MRSLIRRSSPPREKSLTYHVEMAHHISQTLQHIVRNMHNRSEVTRIRKEKELKEEMERREKEDAEARHRSLAADRTQFDAANRIASIFYYRKANKVVEEKRIRKQLEAYSKEKQHLTRQVTTIQRSFRLFFTRKHIASFRKRRRTSYNPTDVNQLSRTHGGQRRFENLSELLRYEIKQRRVVEREGLAFDMLTRYNRVCQMHTTNIEFWLKRIGEISLRMGKLEQTRVGFRDEQERALSSLSNDGSSLTSVSKQSRSRRARTTRVGSSISVGSDASVTPLTPEQELKLKAIRLAISNAEHLIENCKNQRSWITHVLRSHCRRLSLTKVRFADVVARLSWLPKEQAVLSRVLVNIKVRETHLKGSKDSHLALQWLHTHHDLVSNVAMALDAQQESILMDEIASLASEEKTLVELNSLLTNLCQCLGYESQYSAEKIYLDRAVLVLPKGSDESVRYSSESFILKKKQSDLVNNVIDPIKLAIQSKLDEEDKLMSLVAGFPTDDPSLVAEDMPSTLSAVLLDEYRPSIHFNLLTFIEVYYIQPWLSREAVEDVRIEDEIILQELEVDTMELEIKAVKDRIRRREDLVKDIEIKLRELGEELEYQSQESKNKIFEDKDNEDLTQIIKKEMMTVLNQELNKITLQKKEFEDEIAKMNDLVAPAALRVEKITNEIIRRREEIDRRAAERRRLEKIFFDLEDSINMDGADLMTSIVTARDLVLDKLASSNQKLSCCCDWLENARLREKYRKNDLIAFECEMLGFPMNLYQLNSAIDISSATLNPSLFSHPLELINLSIETRKHILEMDVQQFHFELTRLNEELEATRGYGARRAVSEVTMLKFQNLLHSLR